MLADPIIPGWFQLTSRGLLQLTGQKCTACGVYLFPPATNCKRCGSRDLSEALLGPDARVHSVTTDATGMFLGRPHLVGQVQFAEGPFVQGFVDAPVDCAPQIGSMIELVPFDVPAPQSDGTLITYAFRPKEDDRA